MNEAETTSELLTLLRAAHSSVVEDIDEKQLKYALYARKSTQDDERQERSIDDQVKDCLQGVVVPRGLNVVQVIQESYSAKNPDVRPKFRQLVEDIKSGKINGLISWHPDRIARNMKEAGEIIDLLDKGTLKDLKFSTFTYENNPTGKMLLGISFVLSKQYSEHLSESVSRGNRRATEDDGQFIGKMKHGYYINDDRHLYPDGDNYLIVQNIFQMRLNGSTQTEIRDWINTQPYQVRRRGYSPQSFKWDKDDVSKALRDPVYAGVLKFGNSIVDLTEKYDFTPMISVPEFLKLNKLPDFNSAKILSAQKVKGGKIKANLLRGMVKCGYCGKSFSSGLTPKNLKDGRIYYYNYRCETEGCEYKNKSIRAKVILGFVIEFFQEYLFITEENYDQYVKDAKREIADQTKLISSEVASLSKTLGEQSKSYEETKELLRKQPDLSKHYDLEKEKSQVDDTERRLKELIGQRNGAKGAIVEYKKYLELIQNIPVILEKMHDMEAMDVVIKNFFSNFIIKDLGRAEKQRYEIEFKLKEPWKGFLENGKFVLGRGERT